MFAEKHMADVKVQYEQGTLQVFDFPPSKLGFNTNVRYVSFFMSIDRFLDPKNNFDLGANVRDPGDTKATKAMVETLTNTSERLKFWGFNSGLILIAKTFKSNKSKKEMTLGFPENFGLLNGGHTQYAIHQALKTLTQTPHPLIRVEVLVGDFTDDEVSEIAKARNTTANVKDSTIWNKQKLLEPVKTTLGNKLSRMVKWRGKNDQEAENGAVEADNLLHWIMLIEGTSYSSNIWSNPHISQGAGTAAEAFIKLVDDGKSRHLELIANDVVMLRDEIKSGFAFKTGNSGATQPGISKIVMNGKVLFKEKKTAVKMPFNKSESVRPVSSDAYMFPIIAAFGTMLTVSKDSVKWKKNPHEMWANETLRATLVKRVKDVIKQQNTAIKVKNDKQMFELLCQDIVSFQQKHATKKGISDGPEYKIS